MYLLVDKTTQLLSIHLYNACIMFKGKYKCNNAVLF